MNLLSQTASLRTREPALKDWFLSKRHKIKKDTLTLLESYRASSFEQQKITESMSVILPHIFLQFLSKLLTTVTTLKKLLPISRSLKTSSTTFLNIKTTELPFLVKPSVTASCLSSRKTSLPESSSTEEEWPSSTRCFSKSVLKMDRSLITCAAHCGS